jgi:transposase
MRPKGSPAELEARRRLAGRLLLEGRKIGEVAQIVAASESSVRRWHRAVKKGGLEALEAKPHPGRRPRLNAKQKRRLVKILLAGPRKAGYRTDLWTCPRVAEVIAEKFGVTYHPSHVWKVLRSLGLTPQKPDQRARERDEAAIFRWRERDWPRIKRGQSVGGHR